MTSTDNSPAVRGSLPSDGFDEAALEAHDIAGVLDRVTGAYERARLGLERARQGQTIPLEVLDQDEDRR